MPNPYTQVARTYLKRLFCSLKRSLITSGIALILFIGFFKDESHYKKLAFPPGYFFPFIVLFVYWAIHVKGQFTDARASLTPGYRKVHGVVAIIVAIIFVIILPGIKAPLIGWQSSGLISISTLLFGIILWSILRMGPAFLFLMSAGFFLVIHKPVWNRIEPIVYGKEPVQAFIIMSIGVILSITGIIRLFLLNEEKPEYHLNRIPNYRQGKMSGQQWWKWLQNRKAVRMIYHARHATDSYWSRLHRWNYSGFYVWHGLFMAIYMFFSYKLMELWSGTNTPSGFKIAFATIIPIILATMQLASGKKSFPSHELMMPVRRDTYLKQVGMLFASNQFIFWVVMIAGSIVDISTKAVKPGTELLIFTISYSLMMQIWFFGLAAWILSFRSYIIPFIIMPIALFFSVRNIPNLEKQVVFPLWILILGAFLACLGLFLTWWGYRRWMVADLE